MSDTIETKFIKVASICRQAEYRIHQLQPDISPIWIKDLKNNATRLAKQTMSSPVPFILAIDFARSGTGDSIFDEPAWYIQVQSSQPSDRCLVVTVDREGRKVDHHLEAWDEAHNWEDVWAGKVSHECQGVVFHIYGHSVCVFHRGQLVERVSDVSRPRYPFSQRSNRHGRAHEFADLIRRHFEDRIQFQRAVLYWADKANRKFVGAPEEIFQRDLRWYLDEYLLDHRTVTMEYCADGLTDRTDIWIETVDNEHYVLELKWLGRTITGGSYDEKRALRGARQTIEYINRIPRIKKAALVLYDGRSTNEDIHWTTAQQHPKLDLSLRLYILSETASQVAQNAVP